MQTFRVNRITDRKIISGWTICSCSSRFAKVSLYTSNNTHTENGFWFSLPQDAFDHDKGQKSAISRRLLRWIFMFSPVLFLLPFPQVLVFSVISRENRPKMWSKLPDFRAEKKRRILSRLRLWCFFLVPIATSPLWHVGKSSGRQQGGGASLLRHSTKIAPKSFLCGLFLSAKKDKFLPGAGWCMVSFLPSRTQQVKTLILKMGMHLWGHKCPEIPYVPIPLGLKFGLLVNTQKVIQILSSSVSPPDPSQPPTLMLPHVPRKTHPDLLFPRCFAFPGSLKTPRKVAFLKPRHWPRLLAPVTNALFALLRQVSLIFFSLVFRSSKDLQCFFFWGEGGFGGVKKSLVFSLVFV